jgi:mRNA interferase HigB
MWYATKYPIAANALFDWYHDLAKSDFRNFHELKRIHRTASLVGDNRVVFNIMGNRYRLVVRIVFEFKVVQIKWFGPHSDYDLIDVSIIDIKK